MGILAQEEGVSILELLVALSVTLVIGFVSERVIDDRGEELYSRLFYNHQPL